MVCGGGEVRGLWIHRFDDQKGGTDVVAWKPGVVVGSLGLGIEGNHKFRKSGGCRVCWVIGTGY